MNLYGIILGLFSIVGMITALCGWQSLKKSKKCQQWTVVEGIIESSKTESEEDDLLPEIRFRYTVAKKIYSHTVQFPPGTTPIPGFSEQYVEKYPQGKAVSVYVNPDQPSDATLDPTQGGGSGLMIAIGGTMALLGLSALFF